MFSEENCHFEPEFGHEIMFLALLRAGFAPYP
jgi:hypothetical protein